MASPMSAVTGGGAGGFNKMLVMLPVMLAARKLDGENARTVHMVRIAYGVVQLVSLLLVVYAYHVAGKVSNQRNVYVPPAPSVRENDGG
jgi:Phosphate transport (Pho88)